MGCKTSKCAHQDRSCAFCTRKRQRRILYLFQFTVLAPRAGPWGNRRTGRTPTNGMPPQPHGPMKTSARCQRPTPTCLLSGPPTVTASASRRLSRATTVISPTGHRAWARPAGSTSSAGPIAGPPTSSHRSGRRASRKARAASDYTARATVGQHAQQLGHLQLK